MKIIGHFALAIVVTVPLSMRGGEVTRPNIVHIIVDDLGWNDVGFHGSEIKTPNIDRLARRSVVLDRFYVTPICSPTRAGALTGRYPFRFGIWDGVISPSQRHGLPPQELTIPELLAKCGYRERLLMGKWHLGLASTMFHPLNHGFTYFYGHYNGAIDYFSRMRFGELDWHKGYESLAEEGYTTDLLGEAAVDFINNRRTDAPFYLLLAFNAPHSPLQATRHDLDSYGYEPGSVQVANVDQVIADREGAPDYGDRGRGNSNRQTFAAMTTALDRNVGAILEALHAQGILENTIVAFHSDNGADPRRGGSNLPLRGGKFTTWEGGTRVIAMISWPARLPESATYEHVTSYVDWLPTFVAAAGGDAFEHTDGLDLLPYLVDSVDPPDRLFFLDDDTVVCDRWKLVGDQLFDLAADPNEKTNVAPGNPNVASYLSAEAAKFAQMCGPKTATTLPRPPTWPPSRWQLPVEP